jgi:ATP-dependent phosphofructokinase / diphosphate-dependent phosphofructokinase
MEVLKGNCLIAQSGGPTAVINASACGAIQEALKSDIIETVYAAHNGILGVLERKLFDLGKEDPADIEGLKTTPAAALGSCRYKVKTKEDYEKILQVFRDYNIRYFFYIGGNDSMDTADKVNRLADEQGYAFRAMGIPKTIDNDLALTDHCPGYGSVIKYLAAMVMEAGRDTEALYTTDTVNVIEAMGRNAGWIAAGTALAKRCEEDAPHIILLPEVPFDPDRFKTRVNHYLSTIGRCVIVVSEGTKNPDGSYIAEQKGDFAKDAFGHTQLGGAANYIKGFVEAQCKVKARFAIPSTIQRAGMHFASLTDSEEAYMTGQAAVRHALAGESGKMVTLLRCSGGAGGAGGSSAARGAGGATGAAGTSGVAGAGLGSPGVTEAPGAGATGASKAPPAAGAEVSGATKASGGSTAPENYRCETGLAELSAVANGEKLFPRHWIGEDGYSVTEEFLAYARPLIQGEVAPIMEGGLPRFIRFKKQFV